MFLIDTNILSELVKKKPNKNLIGRLENVPSASLFTATICIMELRYGALRMVNGADLWAMIQKRIISKLQLLNFTKKRLKQPKCYVNYILLESPLGSRTL